MFERFTERARQVVVLAQQEAQAFKHDRIGTEHILLGLLSEEEGLASRVLDSLDITLEEVRQQVGRICGQGTEIPSGHLPFTPRAKKVLELALREALSLAHNYIGTEHILLGLVRENEGVAARILLDFDAGAEKVRYEIIRLVTTARKSDTSADGRTAGEVVDAEQRLADAAKRMDEVQARIDKVRADAVKKFGAPPEEVWIGCTSLLTELTLLARAVRLKYEAGE